MVKVATTLDVPIKLLWAKSVTFTTERGFTMLGLGDIVVPGMFVALALRYDYHRASADGSRGFSKPYFYAALFAYFAGLATTMMVMHVFKAAQPALLYLRCAVCARLADFVLTRSFAVLPAFSRSSLPPFCAGNLPRHGIGLTKFQAPSPGSTKLRKSRRRRSLSRMETECTMETRSLPRRMM